MEEKWDHLILLDACRFDYFEQVYPAYLTGQLGRRISVGSYTPEWRDRSFPGKYDDVVYVSSNPYINSVMPLKGFLGRDHFHRVIDVWKFGWDDRRGTVPPDKVTRAAIAALREHPGKRLIVHYLQPHAPYLCLDPGQGGFPVPDVAGGRVLSGLKSGTRSGIRMALLGKLTRIARLAHLLGGSPDLKIRELLRMPPASPLDAARRSLGDEGLRRAYRANLQMVLEEVAGLIKYMSGRIVVTADHGEMLGEEGYYSHPGMLRHPLLIEIPWLRVDRDRPKPSPARAAPGEECPPEGGDPEDEEAIRKRLQGLGYMD
jgi:hypothetical protein